MAEVRFPKFTNLLLLPDSVARFLSLHARSGYNAKNMYCEQFGYSHREILLKYCGLDSSVQILGNLQHGVILDNYFNGRANLQSPRFLFGKKTSFWVFSSRTMKLAHAQGFKRVIAIGAPWLYLRKSVDNGLPRMKEKRSLVMPGHSAYSYPSRLTSIEKRKRAAGFREIVGSGMATVCLHPSDYLDPECVDAYIEEGFKITCIGAVGVQPYWTDAGNRVRALYTLMTLMSTHTELVTDRYGTHLFYAIDLGLNVGIYPELFPNYSITDVSGRKTIYEDLVDIDLSLLYLNQMLPKLINQIHSSKEYREISDEVLGVDAILTPRDLLQILEYRRNVYPVTPIQPW